MRQWKEAKFADGQDRVSVFYPVLTEGSRILRPGLQFKVEGTKVYQTDAYGRSQQKLKIESHKK